MADKKTYTINEDLSLSESMTKTQIENKIKESVNNQAGIYKLSEKDLKTYEPDTVISLSDVVTNYDYLIFSIKGTGNISIMKNYIVTPFPFNDVPQREGTRKYWKTGYYIFENWEIYTRGTR